MCTDTCMCVSMHPIKSKAVLGWDGDASEVSLTSLPSLPKQSCLKGDTVYSHTLLTSVDARVSLSMQGVMEGSEMIFILSVYVQC